MGEARKAGWGRGPKEGREHCADCRQMKMMVKAFGEPAAFNYVDGMVN